MSGNNRVKVSNWLLGQLPDTGNAIPMLPEVGNGTEVQVVGILKEHPDPQRQEGIGGKYHSGTVQSGAGLVMVCKAGQGTREVELVGAPHSGWEKWLRETKRVLLNTAAPLESVPILGPGDTHDAIPIPQADLGTDQDPRSEAVETTEEVPTKR
jgi:hypothetical protein